MNGPVVTTTTTGAATAAPGRGGAKAEAGVVVTSGYVWQSVVRRVIFTKHSSNECFIFINESLDPFPLDAIKTDEKNYKIIKQISFPFNGSSESRNRIFSESHLLID